MSKQLSLFDDHVEIALNLDTRTDKHCPGCNETKPLSYFYRRKANPDGYGYQCANCENPDRQTNGPVRRKW